LFNGIFIELLVKLSTKRHTWRMHAAMNAPQRPTTTTPEDEGRYASQDRGSQESYERYLAAMDASMREKIARTTAHFPAEGVIADLGSGSGLGSFAIASLYPNVQVIGIDVNQAMVDYASGKHLLPNLKFVRADIGSEFAPPSSLDGVFACSVFHHLTSFNRFSLAPVRVCLDKISEALKPGGKLVVRDFVIPEGPRQVLLDLPTTDGKSEGSPEELSTAKLFEQFARDFRSNCHPISGVPYADLGFASPGWQRFQVSLRDANEFLLRKDYRKTWAVELQEEYSYFSQKEFCAELEKRGLRISYSSEILNPWIEQHRYEGKAKLWDLNGAPLPFPPTTIVIAATKVPGGEGNSFSQHPLAVTEDHSFTALKFFRHKETGEVFEVASRPNPTVDLLPWYEERGDLWVIGKMDYPRPLLTVDESSLDGSHLAGYIAEPITGLIDEVKESSIERTLEERSGIHSHSIINVVPGLRYYPSPGAVDQCAESVLIEVRKPEAPFSTPHYSNLSTSGSLKAVEVQQLLRAAAVGGLFDSRLEINAYHLLLEKHRAAGPWIGAEISLTEQSTHVRVMGAKELLRPNSSCMFEPISVPMEGKFFEKRVSRFEELSAQGEKVAETTLEYATPRGFSNNTVLLIPLARRNGEILIGIEDRDLPAGIEHGDGSRVLTPPAFRIPKQARTLGAAEEFAMNRLNTEFGAGVKSAWALGGRYFPSPGLLPEVVYPFAVEIDLSNLTPARSQLNWVPLKELVNRRKEIHDAHLLTGVLRASHALGLLVD